MIWRRISQGKELSEAIAKSPQVFYRSKNVSGVFGHTSIAYIAYIAYGLTSRDPSESGACCHIGQFVVRQHPWLQKSTYQVIQ
jgi:hypothetical protein